MSSENTPPAPASASEASERPRFPQPKEQPPHVEIKPDPALLRTITGGGGRIGITFEHDSRVEG